MKFIYAGLFLGTYLLLAPLYSLANTGRLPVEYFANLPDVSNVRLSPNGEYMAALVRVETKEHTGSSLVVFDLNKGTKEILLFTNNEKYKMNWFKWANNKHILLSTRFPETRFYVGTIETRLLIINTKTGEKRNIIPNKYYKRHNYMPQTQDTIVDLLPDDDEHILLGMDLEGHLSNGVLKVSLTKKKVTRYENAKKNFFGFITDRNHKVRIATFFKGTDYEIKHKPIGKSTWQTLWRFESFDGNHVWPLGFDADPNILYVSSLHQGKEAIFKVDLQDPNLSKELVYKNEHYDVYGSLVYSNKTKKVVGLNLSDNKGYIFWDEGYAALQKGIDKALPDTNNYLLSMSDDEMRYILLSTNSANPGDYYVGDRTSKSLNVIAHAYRSLDKNQLSKKKKINYTARDGLSIEGFLTLPQGSSEDKKYPTIIFPHGGPISHDGSGFDYWTQFFTSRGYAVLQMNFRGSSGYGYDFMKAGLKNWGQAMQDDVEDGTHWMIKEGYADPDKICIAGASYGGYAALMGVIKTPDLYQCSISFAGVTDLPKLVADKQHYINGEVALEQIGRNRKLLKEHSPLRNVADITKPVLLIHGAKDRVVKHWHSEKMAKRLKKHNKQYEYLTLDNGTHFLSNSENRIATFQAMDKFLAEHLQ